MNAKTLKRLAHQLAFDLYTMRVVLILQKQRNGETGAVVMMPPNSEEIELVTEHLSHAIRIARRLEEQDKAPDPEQDAPVDGPTPEAAETRPV
jgi:hypothetical protein